MTADGLDLGAFRDSVRAVLHDLADPLAQCVGHDIAGPIWAKAAELGWFGIAVEETFGGLGVDRAALATLYEELGRHVAPAPMLGAALAAEAISANGGAAVRQALLPRIAAGALRVALPAGSFGVGGAPIRRDARGRLTGVIPDIIGGTEDDFVMAFTAARGGTTLCLVDRGAEGSGLALQETIDITRSLGAVTFNGVSIDDSHALDLSSEGIDDLSTHAWIAIAADSLGGAEAILERTVTYMKQREQFDRPIGSFQALKHRAAQWKVLTEATRAIVQSAATKWAANAPDRAIAAASAKVYAAEAYAAIAGDAVQLHGGIGFTWAHPCHLYLKRAKLNQVLFGGAAELKDLVASRAFANEAVGAA